MSAIHIRIGHMCAALAVLLASAVANVQAQCSYPRLNASDAAMNDEFGASVAVLGDTALVGAPGDDRVRILPPINLTDAGAAYVFTRNGMSWAQAQKIVATDAANGDFFGQAVALMTPDTLIVGAPDDDNA